MKILKCIMVGDNDVGISSIITFLATNCFFPDNESKYFNNCTVNIEVDDEPVTINLLKMSCPEDYERERPSPIQNVDIFLICFSLVDPNSFENVEKNWHPLLHLYSPSAKVILIGTKLDLRDNYKTIKMLENKNQVPITYKKGIEMAKKIGAIKYFECSALTFKGVNDMVDEIARVDLTKEETLEKDSKCILL